MALTKYFKITGEAIYNELVRNELFIRYLELPL
jgi:hypothetical protein